LSRRVLCIVAHPDDECFAFGGALALAAAQGCETHVLCLTDGQAASNRGSATTDAELGSMRRDEFTRSCQVLGVTGHEMLDYQDGQLEFEDFSQTAERLVQKIRALQPDIVITFGMDGALNTHPDHTVVSALTSAAVHWAASPKRYPEAGSIHRVQRFFTLTTIVFFDDRPAPMPSPWTVQLDISSVLEQKKEAFRQHTSQAPLIERTRFLFERFGGYEFYTLQAQSNAGPATLATDFFTGM
jgi:LmbE family N-acetylglucosaminyl deacetylase